jgi:hypothetical protein
MKKSDFMKEYVFQKDVKNKSINDAQRNITICKKKENYIPIRIMDLPGFNSVNYFI